MSRKRRILTSVTIVTLLLLLSVSIASADTGGYINGGGQIHEVVGSKRRDWHVISFGGWIQGKASPVGEWQVNFHNVEVDAIDKSHFHSSDIQEVNYYPGNGVTCDAAFNMTVLGAFNNEPGYTMIFRAGDSGSLGFADTVRVELYAPGGGKVYDTHWANEFNNESSCVGTARTGLDAGNITIVRP